VPTAAARNAEPPPRPRCPASGAVQVKHDRDRRVARVGRECVRIHAGRDNQRDEGVPRLVQANRLERRRKRTNSRSRSRLSAIASGTQASCRRPCAGRKVAPAARGTSVAACLQSLFEDFVWAAGWTDRGPEGGPESVAVVSITGTSCRVVPRPSAYDSHLLLAGRETTFLLAGAVRAQLGHHGVRLHHQRAGVEPASFEGLLSCRVRPSVAISTVNSSASPRLIRPTSFAVAPATSMFLRSSAPRKIV
jgi:hypothetical protein